MATYFQEETLEKKDYTVDLLPVGEYEDCTFRHCNFAGNKLRDCKFIECEFIECDLSNVDVMNSMFQEVAFNQCKLVGVGFEHCNDFGFAVRFQNCQLNLSTFYQMKLGRSAFTDCLMDGVDFAESDLHGVSLVNCNLQSAIFDQTDLRDADLSGATNYSIDTEYNRISGAKFSMPEVLALLNKFNLRIEQ